MISKLQYITPENSLDYSAIIDEVCNAGIDWVQLRLKDRKKEEIIAIGKEILPICKKHNATLIINDSISICETIGADGVHLGRSDDNIEAARNILGKNAIIGATVNTFEHIKEAVQKGIVNYAGLGPYRQTSSKKNLSPILGKQGIKEIFDKYHQLQYNLPIVLIGGIVPEDVKHIIKHGAHGVAVISGINQAKDKKQAIQAYLNEFL